MQVIDFAVDSLLSLLSTDSIIEVLLLLLKRCCPINTSSLLRRCSATCHGSFMLGCGGLNADSMRQVMQRVHVRAMLLLLLRCTLTEMVKWEQAWHGKAIDCGGENGPGWLQPGFNLT
ncbi:hypothetical protein WJX77_008706 [Trebouxia sp. C0004]